MRTHHAGLALSALVALWQVAIWLGEPPSFLMPSPAAVAAALVHRPGFFLEHGLVTLTEILAGLLSGTALGIATAFGLAALPRFGQLVWPIVLILQALPVFVLAPILVLWLGFGMASKVAMTTIIIFFPVASAFADGLRRTDRAILDAVSLTEATHWQALIRIRVPLALPGLVSGLRVAAPLAPLAAVVGEWVGASAGLGFVMVQANARMQTDTVFAAMAVLAALTILMRIAVDRLTAGLAPWAAETDPPAFRSLHRRDPR
ncbi:ABC transporter permease [Mycoplana ramosa]|uniref:ABC transporter permease n=1 Tax=Mycoplana ramosa TaxID=40837 RepID=A0ABW3Z1N5_MYCRA